LVVATGLNKSIKNVPGLEEPLLRDNELRSLVYEFLGVLTKMRLQNHDDNATLRIKERRNVESITSAHFYDSTHTVEKVLTQNIKEYEKGRIVFALESSTNVAEPEILYSVSSNFFMKREISF